MCEAIPETSSDLSFAVRTSPLIIAECASDLNSMGNLTRRLAALDLGGHRMLLDELGSSKEVMIRFPSDAVKWIDQEPPVLRLIESLIQILEEFPLKRSSSPRPSTRATHTASQNSKMNHTPSSTYRNETAQTSQRAMNKGFSESPCNLAQTSPVNFSKDQTNSESGSAKIESAQNRTNQGSKHGANHPLTRNTFIHRHGQSSRDGSISIESEFEVQDQLMSFRRAQTHEYKKPELRPSDNQRDHSRGKEANLDRLHQPPKPTQTSISELQRQINQKLQFATLDLDTVSFDDDGTELSWKLNTELSRDNVDHSPPGHRDHGDPSSKKVRLNHLEKENEAPLSRTLTHGRSQQTQPNLPYEPRHQRVSDARPPRFQEPSKQNTAPEEMFGVEYPHVSKSHQDLSKPMSFKRQPQERVSPVPVERNMALGRTETQSQPKDGTASARETDTYFEPRASISDYNRGSRDMPRAKHTPIKGVLTSPVELGYVGEDSGHPTHRDGNLREKRSTTPSRRRDSDAVNPLLRLGSIETRELGDSTEHPEGYELDRSAYFKGW